MANNEISLSNIRTTRPPVPTAQPVSINQARQGSNSGDMKISTVGSPRQNAGEAMEFNIAGTTVKPTPPPQKPINAVVQEEVTPEQHAEAAKAMHETLHPNDVSPTMQQQPAKPSIKMSANTRQRNGQGQRRRIDPSTMARRKPQSEGDGISRDHMEKLAFTDLDSMIERKKKELNEAVIRMAEEDTKNRLAVTEGLETVEKELLYMAPQDKDGNALTKGQAATRNQDDIDDDEIERDLDMIQNVRQGGNTPQQPERRAAVKVMNNPVVQQQPQEEQIQFNVQMSAPEHYENQATEEYADQQYEDQLPQVDEYYEDEENTIPVAAESPEDFDPAQFYDPNVYTQQQTQTEVYVEQEEQTQPVVHEAAVQAPVVEEKAEPVDQKELFGSKNVVRHTGTSQEKPAERKQITKSDFELDPEDFADVENDDYYEEEEAKLSAEEEKLVKAGQKNLNSQVLEKIVGTARKIDVSTYKVSNRTASLQDVLNRAKNNNPTKTTAAWPLMNLGRPFIASALTGPDIILLTGADENRNTFFTNYQQLSVIYNHDENPYKPTTLEGWMKTIPFWDVDELFMALFVATYGRANYLPYECSDEKCHNMELKKIDDIKGSMVKFKNDKQKVKFDQIVNTPLTPDNSIEYESVIVPINDSIAIGFAMPSLYTMIMELRSLNQKFQEKYAAVITVMTYIDKIYTINPETQTFDKVDYKLYPGNIAKTFKSKIASYARILHMLTPSEFNVMTAYLNSIQGEQEVLNYVLPEEHCSKCGHKIEERTTVGKTLVFTQQQLVNMATITEE